MEPYALSLNLPMRRLETHSESGRLSISMGKNRDTKMNTTTTTGENRGGRDQKPGSFFLSSFRK